MRSITRRTALGALSAFAVQPAMSQPAWPSRAIILLHGFPPGGPVDAQSRVVADGLSRRLGQQVVVESRPGAAGTTAAGQLARAAPDGYTVAVIPATYAAAAAMYKNLSYRPIEDFTMIGMIADFPLVLVTHSEYRIATIADLISAAKSRSSPLTYGSPGQGSTLHLLGELFARTAKITLQHVPYRGSAPALTDLLGKRIDFVIDAPIAPLEHIKSGTLHAIAVSGAARFLALPDVPTLTESGFPGFVVTGWSGLIGPAGLPASIVSRLNSEMAALLTEPPVIERIRAFGAEPKPTSSDEFKALLAADIARWTSIVAEANIERI